MLKTTKNNLEVSSEYGPFYNSGKISVTNEHLVCTYKSQVNMVCRKTGKTEWTIPLGELSVTCTQISPDGQKLVVADTSLHLQLFDLKTKEINGQNWRSLHLNHIRCMKFNEAGNLLATGGTDSSIKIWDTDYRYCTHSFKRGGGVITSLLFQPFGKDDVRLFSGADSGEICLFDLRKKSVVQTSTHHSSAVTDMILSEDNKTLISSGRDSVVTLWSAEKLIVQKTVAVYEPIESVLLVTKYFPQATGHCFVTAGSKGILKVWDSVKGSAILTVACGQHENGIQQICDVPSSQNPEDEAESSLVVVGNNFIISLHDIKSLECQKQFCGFFDDVLEVKYFGHSEEFLAVANNSPHIIVYTIITWGCQILRGHTDIVVGLEVSPSNPQLMASCSKDNSFRLWQADAEGSINCVAMGQGHTLSVEAVAFLRSSPKLIFSVSSDCMLKIWSTPAHFDANEVLQLKTTRMKNAHAKPISCVAVSPNDSLVATGSEDHTAKLWCVSTLEVQGVLKGHKHGLTSVQFSPVDKCVVTASRDRSIRIWRITDQSVAMVLEHEMPVMKLILINQGRQVLSGTSDGFLNIWDLLTQTLQSHLEGHSQHAWALDVSKDGKQVVSGGSDSLIRFWQDVTDRDRAQELEQKEDYICKEQSLSNALKSGNLRRALHLALDLDKPHNVYKIFKDLLSIDDESSKLVELVSNLSETRKRTMVNYLIKWNTNNLYSDVGQFILQKLLDTNLPSDRLLTKQQCRDLQSYTERHYKKRKLLDEKSKFIPYLLQQMITGFTVDDPLGTGTQLLSS